jgi:hypothetical protein
MSKEKPFCSLQMVTSKKLILHSVFLSKVNTRPGVIL